MKAETKKTTNLVVGGMVVVAAIAIAFWMLLLSPKRDEVSKFEGQVTQLEGSLAEHESEIATAEEARKQFPVDYEHLVVLGKAVPSEDETASLLVQISRIAEATGVRFQTLTLDGAGETEATEETAPTSTGESVSPTEASASLSPLGATVGPAGLTVMPYSLTFQGDFFKVADFIKGLDSLVKTTNEDVGVNGRLITINGFSLQEDPNAKFPMLLANFSVTTYLTPPAAEPPAAAAPEGPSEGLSSVPASTTIGGAP
jgi:Tfp pilus assembly protein PilO